MLIRAFSKLIVFTGPLIVLWYMVFVYFGGDVRLEEWQQDVNTYVDAAPIRQAIELPPKPQLPPEEPQVLPEVPQTSPEQPQFPPEEHQTIPDEPQESPEEPQLLPESSPSLLQEGNDVEAAPAAVPTEVEATAPSQVLLPESVSVDASGDAVVDPATPTLPTQ